MIQMDGSLILWGLVGALAYIFLAYYDLFPCPVVLKQGKINFSIAFFVIGYIGLAVAFTVAIGTTTTLKPLEAIMVGFGWITIIGSAMGNAKMRELISPLVEEKKLEKEKEVYKKAIKGEMQW